MVALAGSNFTKKRALLDKALEAFRASLFGYFGTACHVRSNVSIEKWDGS